MPMCPLFFNVSFPRTCSKPRHYREIIFLISSNVHNHLGAAFWLILCTKRQASVPLSGGLKVHRLLNSIELVHYTTPLQLAILSSYPTPATTCQSSHSRHVSSSAWPRGRTAADRLCPGSSPRLVAPHQGRARCAAGVR